MFNFQCCGSSLNVQCSMKKTHEFQGQVLEAPAQQLLQSLHEGILYHITHTIVTICQRSHQRVKSESSLSDSFERQRSSRQSLKDRRRLKERERQGTILSYGFLFKVLTFSQNRSAVNRFLDRSFHFVTIDFLLFVIVFGGKNICFPNNRQIFIQKSLFCGYFFKISFRASIVLL